MKAFTIDDENNITAFASASAAKKSGSGPVFATREALETLALEWPINQLVETWNSITGVTGVKRFKDRGTAVTRIWNAIQRLEGAPDPASTNTEHPELSTGAGVDAAPALSGPAREGSKRARIFELMNQPGGVTLEAIMAETGWLKHTVRGFVSGSLVKKGVAVESFKREDGQRAYRVLA